MKTRTPETVDLSHIETWVFDLDNTLYSADLNLFAEVDRRMGEFIVQMLDISYDQARRLQKHYYREHGTTLNGLMHTHGMEPEAFLDYVHDIDISKVKPDAELETLLDGLPGRKIVFTNSSLAHSERVMDALNVAHHFEDIFDIAASSYVPKHEPGAFGQLIEKLDFDPGTAVMFDDIAKNLVEAHARGMTTVWVRTDTDWGAPRDPDAPIVESTDHVEHETPDLLSFLKRVWHRDMGG